jgi:signal transduction histidine kinase/ActR/RegA family two-component response regulator
MQVPAAKPPATLEQRIHAEQVRTAFGGPPTDVPSTVVPNIVVGLCMVWIMREQAAEAVVWGWLALLVVFQLSVPDTMARRFWRRHGEDVDAAARWGRLFALQATANGLIWGAAGALFFPPDSPIHLALLSAILCGMAAGAIPVTAMLLPALYGAATAMLLPLAVSTFFAGGALHTMLAVLLVIYWTFTLNTGRAHNRLFRDSFRQRFENLELIRRLTEQTALAEAAKDEAVEADRAKSKFLAAASHDLRQPLHAATLFCGALLNAREPADMRRIGGQLNAAVEALGKLLGSLLDVSRLDAGAVKAQPQDLPLGQLFAELATEFEPLAEEKGLRLRMRPTLAVLHTDPTLFEQALRNLIGNAIRYTDTGGVMVACRRRGTKWRVEVRDSGIGIPAAEQRNVFREFYQLDNPERDRRKGLGLGLAIVDRVATLLGCALEMRSAPGRGSVFALLVDADISPLRVRTAAALPDERSLAGMRVLIIDDEIEILDAMQALLQQWGCDVIAAESFEQALTRIASGDWQPDVAISDLRLRGSVDGIATLDRLRTLIRPDLSCVLITGDTAAERLQTLQRSGYAVLHKPVRPGELRAALDRSVPAAMRRAA